MNVKKVTIGKRTLLVEHGIMLKNVIVGERYLQKDKILWTCSWEAAAEKMRIFWSRKAC